ncbi:NAD-dependent epimerase/dehydratase [Methanolacinia petrolearia DSM 11571]|uniref:NAD-dependent epimerase/dehydratase n=1 Tax=Methanolacinia petrolearia (strain DSM 11571 / OCM 486 / SEBR 4847) TaxID=679926 RepID=E1RFD7_METP4|nr:GDP-mannose 4,6-dehydratase [Methanolacinia petrolearia]ADN36167.1 NAD-dependent epimerase/dehydratase [Methanolacinia petrolearia DSM 11571]
MKKILITGISGFVGGHFVDYINKNHSDFEIYGISRGKPAWDFVDNPGFHKFYKADLKDLLKIETIIKEIEPDYILHLAAQSSVAESWNTPVESFMNNMNAFLNIIETVRHNELNTRILSVGSSEQYGIIPEEDLPVSEDVQQRPGNPYAVARVSQENLAGVYAKGYGLDICCTRSFNHCGPGQKDNFVVSSLVKQFVMIAKGLQEPVLHIGNGAVIRDFLDVHDVVEAYFSLLSKGKSGEAYNICSGVGRSIVDIIEMLSGIYGIDVEIRQEASRLRPADNPRIIGSNKKICRDTGWKPKISFEETLRSVYDYWDSHIIDDV